MNRRIKGGKIIQILEIVGKVSLTTAEILDSLLSGYHESYRRARGLPSLKREFKSKEERIRYRLKQIETEEKQRFYNLLSKLKREGFIEKSKSGFWKITAKGKLKKKESLQRGNNVLPAGRYSVQNSKEFKIVIFDIPEKEKRKRNWLRAVLKRLGFKMLQKSVWIGEVILPEDFISDLRKLRLLQFVEILAITKTGSLRYLK